MNQYMLKDKERNDTIKIKLDNTKHIVICNAVVDLDNPNICF